jgi:hypothetical protein
MLPFLARLLFAFYIQDVLKFKWQIQVKKGFMHLILKHREEGCRTSLTGCIGPVLVLWMKIVQSHVDMSGHVILGAGTMYMATGAIRSTLVAAMEVLLHLTPLDLLIMAEARMTFCRLHIPKQTPTNGIAVGLISIRKGVGDIILETRPDYTIPVYSWPLTYELNSFPRKGRNSS